MGYNELYQRYSQDVGTRQDPWPDLFDRIQERVRHMLRVYEAGTTTAHEMICQFLYHYDVYADCCIEAGYDISRVQELVAMLPVDLRQQLQELVKRSPRTEIEWRSTFEIHSSSVRYDHLSEEELEQMLRDAEELRVRIGLILYPELRRGFSLE